MRTCITLYSYVELQQKYLEYKGFQGTINVTMRFAHPSSWDVHNYEAKAALIGGKWLQYLSAFSSYQSKRLTNMSFFGYKKVGEDAAFFYLVLVVRVARKI